MSNNSNDHHTVISSATTIATATATKTPLTNNNLPSFSSPYTTPMIPPSLHLSTPPNQNQRVLNTPVYSYQTYTHSQPPPTKSTPSSTTQLLNTLTNPPLTPNSIQTPTKEYTVYSRDEYNNTNRDNFTTPSHNNTSIPTPAPAISLRSALLPQNPATLQKPQPNIENSTSKFGISPITLSSTTPYGTTSNSLNSNNIQIPSRTFTQQQHQKRMMDVEMSSFSHQVLLLKNELNEKELALVEMRGQLHQAKIQADNAIKQKESVLVERTQAANTLREELEMKLQLISTLQKEVKLYETRLQQVLHQQQDNKNSNSNTPNIVVVNGPIEFQRKLREKEQEVYKINQTHEDELRKKSQEILELQQKGLDQSREISHLKNQLQQSTSIQGHIENDLKITKNAFDEKEKVDARKFSDLEINNKTLRSQVSHLEASLLVSQTENTSLKSQISEHEKSISSLKDKINSFKTHMQKLEERSSHLKNSQQVEQEIADAVENENEHWRKEIELREKIIDQSRSDMQKMRNELQKWAQEGQSREDLVMQLEETVKRKEKRNSELSDVISQLEKRIRESDSSRQEENDREMEALHSELRNKDIDIAQLREELKQRVTQVGQAINQNTQRDKDLERVQNEKTLLERNMADLRAELRARERHIDQLTNDLNARDVSFYELEDLRRELTLSRKNYENSQQECKRLSEALDQYKSGTYKEREIEMHKNLATLEQLAQKQQTEIQGFLRDSIERDALIAQMEKDLTDKSAEISQLKEKQLSISASELTTLQNTLKEQELHIKELESYLSNEYGGDITIVVRELEDEKIRYRAELKAQLEDIRIKNSQLEKQESAKKLLSEEVTRLKEQLRAISKRGYNPSTPQTNGHLKMDEEDERKQQKAKNEAVSCIAELTSLRQLIKMRIEGKDPNLSTLGVGASGLLPGSPFKVENGKLLGINGEVTLNQSLSAIKQEISALRNLVTTHYAEHLGDECNVQ